MSAPAPYMQNLTGKPPFSAILPTPFGALGIIADAEYLREIIFLPGSAETGLAAGVAASEQVRTHPAREEIRVVVGALRAGDAYGVARVRSHPDELLSGADLVPGLASALARTMD